VFGGLGTAGLLIAYALIAHSGQSDRLFRGF